MSNLECAMLFKDLVFRGLSTLSPYLSVNASHLAERQREAGSCAGARGRPDKWSLAPPERPGRPRAAHVHNLKSRFNTVKETVQREIQNPRKSDLEAWLEEWRDAHWLLWGKSNRCCIVMKGWLRASLGAILSSASICNIIFSKLTNSARSTFSANKSQPSRFITRFTWETETSQDSQSNWPDVAQWISQTFKNIQIFLLYTAVQQIM